MQAENNKATCVLGTTGYEDGQYFVKAEARDCAGNVSQNLFQRRYEIDNTGIAKIKMAKCDTLASVIRLRWEDVTETDFAYFLVERKTEKDGSIFWEKVAEITDSLGYDCKICSHRQSILSVWLDMMILETEGKNRMRSH